MKIALIGYGQMGKMLESMAAGQNMEIVAKIDPFAENCHREITFAALENTEVCIDFSTPDSAFAHIEQVTALGKSLVVGTTGWFDRLEEAKELVQKYQTGLVYGSNFSVGMNTFYLINEFTAKLMNKIPGYDVYGFEAHHKKKMDSPSGTAKDLASIIVNNIDRKSEAQYDRVNRKIEGEEFHFASVRAGSVTGTHKLVYDSPADYIELSHVAKNREGFAYGALMAAQWLANQKGIYNFKEVFKEILIK